MPRSLSINELGAYVEKMIARIPQRHQELVAELCGYAIEQCVERSPVLTGAYRASHTVTTDGGSGPGQILYEGVDRVGDDEVVPIYPLARYTPANGADASVELMSAEPFQRLEIRNGRFYASILEYGDATREPRAIYETARLSTEGEAKRLSERGIDVETDR